MKQSEYKETQLHRDTMQLQRDKNDHKETEKTKRHLAEG